jgi:hypothetical protein
MTIDQATLMIKNGQTAQLTLQVAKQTILNGLQAAYNGLLAIAKALTSSWVTILLAVVAAVTAIVVSYDKWYSKEAQLNKEIERTEKAVSKAQEEYKKLGDTILSYNNAVDGIKGLEEGTIEFYQAVIKANEEAKKLIDTLDLIAGKDYTINADGMIEIEEDSLEKALEEQMRELHYAQAEKYAAQANAIRNSEENGIAGVVKEFTKEVNKLLDTSGTNYDFTEEMGEAILSRDEDTLERLLAESEKQTKTLEKPFEIETNSLDRLVNK